MLTPKGQAADRIEKVMLLSIWARALSNHEVVRQDKSAQKTMLRAGFGKPTYPIHPQTIKSNLEYWRKMEEKSNAWFLEPESIDEGMAVDYGNPQGDSSSRELMAQSLSKWYKAEIDASQLLFTVGGMGALHLIFETLNTLYQDLPFYRVITPFPYYSAYANNSFHRLHPIDVMSEPGYRLTAHALEISIEEAYRLAEIDGGYPKAVLICNPSNPLGTVIDSAEMTKIVEVLRHYPDLHLIFDEAYAEMCYVDMPSLIQLAPDLKNRIVILRSATKALSAAGERMAVLLAFNSEFMNELLNKNIQHCVHAPRSSQIAYAQTMAQFDEAEQIKLASFYKKKLDYVLERLHEMGAEMPDRRYETEATFYALGDFNDLLGLELPDNASLAIEKSGLVCTCEDIAYYLLFQDAIMVAPLSYFA
jgi:aspartate aminotransferase/aminotransferase